MTGASGRIGVSAYGRVGGEARSALSRRDSRTQPGVLTPGIGTKKPSRPHKALRVWRSAFVLVLVLEKCGWGGEVLEYCAKSELHPRSGLRLLKGRHMIRSDVSFAVWLTNADSTAPFGRILFWM